MMDDPAAEHVRAAITAAAEARSESLRDLIQQQYSSLVAMAERIHSREANAAAPSPSSLVHEAYVRLVDQPRVSAGGRTFFRACFAQECCRILVDHARRRRAKRRGGDQRHERIATGVDLGLPPALDVLHVNDALTALTALNERMGRIATMRLFGDLTVAECAEAIGISKRTVIKEWAFAQGYLQKELG